MQTIIGSDKKINTFRKKTTFFRVWLHNQMIYDNIDSNTRKEWRLL